MTPTRRSFLQHSSMAAGAHLLASRIMTSRLDRAGVMRPSLSSSRAVRDSPDPPDVGIMEQLARRAVDAAMSAGASYADVRLTHTLRESYTSGSPASAVSGDPHNLSADEWLRVGRFGGYGNGIADRPSSVPGLPTVTIGIGVRAFIQGYWGFAASSSWTDADAVQLGQDAATQARINARAGRPRPAELGTIPIVQRGRWVQPGIDPFTIPVDEKLDALSALAELPVQGHRFATVDFGGMDFQREERVFASSEGTSYSQVRFQCIPSAFVVGIAGDRERGERDYIAWADGDLVDARHARGWEVIRDLDADTFTQTLLQRAIAQRNTSEPQTAVSTKPVEIGKYDVVFDVGPTTTLVYGTLGVATELDRALGYEANAAGTSYLGPDPLQYLGTPVASVHVTLTADRTTPHAVATAQWDDEGVVCSAFPLIQGGVLVDYQSTREQAHWIADWYAKRGMPVQSRGCAVAVTALDFPLQMSPNFTLHPGPDAIDVDDLIKDTERGVYFPSGRIEIDQQVKNGMYAFAPGGPQPREIRNGKLGSILLGAAVSFNSLELWKNVIALGGEKSAQFSTAGESKGEPSQSSQCNVRAVPMKVKDCTMINATRKA